jgi:hypothetical protein
MVIFGRMSAVFVAIGLASLRVPSVDQVVTGGRMLEHLPE